MDWEFPVAAFFLILQSKISFISALHFLFVILLSEACGLILLLDPLFF